MNKEEDKSCKMIVAFYIFEIKKEFYKELTKSNHKLISLHKKKKEKILGKKLSIALKTLKKSAAKTGNFSCCLHEYLGLKNKS